MKLLLDECVPRRLKRSLANHDVSTVDDVGFKGLKNGELLSSAAYKGFEVLITVDQNVRHQQNRDNLPLAIMVLTAQTNRFESLSPLIPEVEIALKEINKGEIIVIE
jgi:predicted nuclease of predicted toxin-antitoxin system